jgi:hypothetical protein
MSNSDTPSRVGKGARERGVTHHRHTRARRAHHQRCGSRRWPMVGTPRKSAALPTLHFFALAISFHFPLSFSLPSSFHSPLREGRAERRWRLDACDAPRSACHDRHADASLDPQPGNARLAFIAHRRQAGVRSICADRASRPDLRRGVLRSQRRKRSPCGAPRGISGPGPCVPLSGMPSEIMRRPHTAHGSSLPGGAGLANLPDAVANRIGDTTASLRLARTPLEDAPQERG